MNKLTIRFDGGCRPTNPGNKYGSYEVTLNGRQISLVSRMELGHGTNNEAEFQILNRALGWVVEQISMAGNTPDDFILELFTDSTIVVNRLTGKYNKCKSEAQKRMAECSSHCLKYMVRFKSFHVQWNSREYNVQRFGH